MFNIRKRYTDADGNEIKPNEYAALQNAVSQTPIDQIPQKKDFVAPDHVDAGEMQPLQTAPIESRPVEAVPPAPMFTPTDNGQFGGLTTPIPSQPIFNPVQSNPNVIRTPYDTARTNYEDAVMSKPQKQGLGKQILFKVFQGLGALGTGQPVDTRFLGEAKRDRAIGQAASVFAPLQQQREFENKQEAIKAQTANYGVDNQNQAEKLKEAKRKNFYSTHKFFDPATATDAEKRQLAEFGETPESVGKYDFTNPKNRTVAGQDFQFDPNDKSWKPSGLPTDGSKSLTEFTVQDPETMETSTYTVTSDRAASFKTSITNAKLNIIAARENNNANREQQANIFNATKAFEAQNENANRLTAYNKQVFETAQQLAAKNGDLDALNSATKGISEAMDAKMREWQNIDIPENPVTDAEKKTAANALERKNKLVDDYNKLNVDLWEKMGKVASGGQALEQLKTLKPTAPTRVVPPQIQAVTTSGGGQYAGKAATLDQLRPYFKGKSDDEIKQIFTGQGGKLL